MPRFFVTHISGETALVEGQDAHHIHNVLRLGVGDSLELCDGTGFDYQSKIIAVNSKAIMAQIISKQPSSAEPPRAIYLYQALCKGDKLDLIVQKAVELGASKIIPVLTARCVSRPDDKSMAKKQERLQKIALSAAGQSGRGLVPTIAPMLDYAKALDAMQQSGGPAIVFYENATQPLGIALGQDTDKTPISILIGPEGGFTEAEIAKATAAGLAVCTLGARILRCETAPLAALAIICAKLERLI